MRIIFLSFFLLIMFMPSHTMGQTATTAEAEAAPIKNVETQLRGILATAFAKIEPWRQKQAKYFTELRDKKKEELGINSAKDVYDALTPEAPEAPATPGSTQQEEDLSDLSTQYDGVDFLGYGVYLYATAFATIFSSIALFYIAAVLLALMVLRFLLRLFR